MRSHQEKRTGEEEKERGEMNQERKTGKIKNKKIKHIKQTMTCLKSVVFKSSTTHQVGPTMLTCRMGHCWQWGPPYCVNLVGKAQLWWNGVV